VIAVPEELTVKVAAVPSKVTLVESVSLLPRMMTVSPTLAAVGIVFVKGARPVESQYTVPFPPGTGPP
jgi:hypothetical protein